MVEEIKFCRVRSVKPPVRSTSHSAGIDFFMPEFTGSFVEDFIRANEERCSFRIIEKEKPIVSLFASANIIIPSGIKVGLSPDKCLIAFNKSSIAFKKGLIVGACVIDSDYQGEIYINLINTCNNSIEIEFGKKLIQYLYMPAEYSELIEYENELELYKNIETLRGQGGFGSTGE